MNMILYFILLLVVGVGTIIFEDVWIDKIKEGKMGGYIGYGVAAAFTVATVVMAVVTFLNL